MNQNYKIPLKPIIEYERSICNMQLNPFYYDVKSQKYIIKIIINNYR